MQRLLPSLLISTVILSLIILVPKSVSATGSPSALVLTAPFPIGVTYLSGHPGVSVASSNAGTGYVKANAAGILSSAIQKSTAAIVFATPAERFTDVNQTGALEIKGMLQSLHIASGTDSGSYILVLAIIEDLNPDLTLSKHIEQTLYLNNTPRSTNSVGLDQTIGMNWVNNHIYRTGIFVIAQAYAAGPGNSAEAHTNFTLNSIVWTAPADFPNSQVSVPVALGVPPIASRGDKVTIYGYGFRASENDKMKLIAIDSNGHAVNGGTNQVVIPQFSTGNGTFQTSFTVPGNATPVPGTFAVRIANVTDNDAIDTAITLSVPLIPSLALPAVEIVPLLMIIAATPLAIRRARAKRF